MPSPWITLTWSGSTRKPFSLVVWPKAAPRVFSTSGSTFTGSPESGLTTTVRWVLFMISLRSSRPHQAAQAWKMFHESLTTETYPVGYWRRAFRKASRSPSSPQLVMVACSAAG